MTVAPSSLRPAQWGRAPVVVLAGVNVAASAVLTLGWSAAGDRDLDSAVSWLRAAVLAVVVAAMCDAWVLAVGRRAVLTRRRNLASSPLFTIGSDPGMGTTGSTVRLAGSNLVHRDNCLLVIGKPVVEVSAAAGDLGLRPCGVCVS